MSTDLHLLREQYDSAVQDEQWLEALCIAGTLARYAPLDARVAEARARTLPLEELHQAMRDTLDAIGDCDDRSHETETWDALSQADETLAGLSIADGKLAHDLVTDLASLLHAFPEPFAAHATTASDLIEREPLDEAALQFWQAVEVAQFEIPNDEEGASPAILAMAGLYPQVARPKLRLVAADDLPQPPDWTVLGSGPEWVLALTQDESGQPVLRLKGAKGEFLRDGHSVATDANEVPAELGTWLVRVESTEMRFTLT